MRSKARTLVVLSLANATLLACAPDVAEPPHVSLQQLRRAVEEGDTAATLQYIDPEAVVSRIMRDAFSAARDSFDLPPADSLGRVFHTAADSVKRELLGLLRTELGLSGSVSAESDSTTPISEDGDEVESDFYPSEELLSEAVEIIGDGRPRYLGDTAFVDRVIRYGYHDTTVTLRLALVPVERSYWRIVAFHNAIALSNVLRDRRLAVLERANKQLRDSLNPRISTRDVTITREPLSEWERYAVEVRATVENHGTRPLVLYSAQLVGPHLSLEDTVAQLLPEPLTIGPKSSHRIVWRHDLHADYSAGLFDLVARPNLYRVEIADVEWVGRPSSRVQLYRTWREFMRRNPLATPPSGSVLAYGSTR